MKEVSDWKLIDKTIESEELFFVKQKIDMNRSKKVRHIQLTIYHDFEDSKPYRGSVAVDIHPTFTDDQIKEKIQNGVLSAKQIKNPPYPLPGPGEPVEIRPTKFFDKSLDQWLLPLTRALFESDRKDGGGLNSAELFLNQEFVRIVNSQGVDVDYICFFGFMEFIAEWTDGPEVVELYRDLQFSDFCPQLISDSVRNQIRLCMDRANAAPTPTLKGAVVICGEAVMELLGYYVGMASAENIYKKISTATIGDSIQGDDVSGDVLDIGLEPDLKNSTKSAAWDMDGVALKSISLYENGVLKNIWGPLRFTHYLDAPTTGNVPNIIVRSGSTPATDLTTPECLEVMAFSDFQCNLMTGDFFGEIRLAYHHTEGNTKKMPVTGGSISGNIKQVQGTMLFSKEIWTSDNFKGPWLVKLFDVNITGGA